MVVDKIFTPSGIKNLIYVAGSANQPMGACTLWITIRRFIVSG